MTRSGWFVPFFRTRHQIHLKFLAATHYKRHRLLVPFNLVRSLTVAFTAPLRQHCHCNHHSGLETWEGINYQRRCGCGWGSEEIEEPVERLSVLINHRMTRLTAFALRIDPEPGDDVPYCGCHPLVFSRRRIWAILGSLPPTCLYLEIDTGGTLVGCICDELRELMPQLHHLHISVPSLCYRFLVPPWDPFALAPDSRYLKPGLLSTSLRSLPISCVF